MGKNLKGRDVERVSAKENDGKYAARYTAKDDSRKEKPFDTLRKLTTGLPMHSTRISTMFTILPPK